LIGLGGRHKKKATMEANHNTPDRKPAGPADYLANERTFLAWIRTSIAIMGFGFVIVKFAVFIRQVSLMMGTNVTMPQNRSSAIVGIVMVILGAIMAGFSYFQYNQIEKRLHQNEYYSSKNLSLLVTLALVVAAVLLVYYLLKNIT
jgi:putative membrane protein